ncbi:permease-like cell division protein FtsX [Tumebacillus permanentifrigoris]|uniref:Cell division protein FtsX n=1 Tax=Tumebacillus permanentifrigoris TaxID=378543 RepID=A0A316D8H5_9BACL|nr:permease-like cell division protein FtsX [Tumebacillus permanentifrigoris]PWK12987.1 cell division protein FtsX [Tumebacillus permanentifrigoris]
MKIRTIGRHGREGLRNLSRNGWMTFASISAVTVTLLLLGVFLLLAYNVQQFSKQLESQVEMNVYVKEGAARADVLELERQLKSLPELASVTYVSKESGLDQLKDKLQENASLLEGLDKENPLPDKFILKAKDPQLIGSVAAKVQTLPLVDKVNYGKDTVEKLFKGISLVRNSGAVFVVGLCFTALFLISNTIKVTIFARRKEIEIMKLVGATNWFIRWPFLIEGLLIGALGAVLPIALLSFGYSYLLSVYPSFMYFNFAAVDLVYSVSTILISIGALIGMIGSVMSISRFLRI